MSNNVVFYQIERSFLTIQEAKEGLAATFGVKTTDIEIIIKA